MKAKILPISLALILGTISFIIGRNSASSSTTTQTSNELPSKGSLSARGSSSAGTEVTSQARRTNSTNTERGGINNTIGQVDPLLRLAEISDITDPLDRTRQWIQFIDGLSESEFEGVVAEMRASGQSQENMEEYGMLLTAWAKINPLAALDYATKNTQNPFARQTILAAWASTDPSGAIAWAKDNFKGEGANPFMVGVIRGLAQNDPQLASSLMAEMPRSQERGYALDSLLPVFLKQGVDTARQWVTSITDEALRNGAMERLADRTIEKDPLGTADWLIANPSESTNRRVDDAIYAMAKKDKDAAMGYFQNLPTGNDRSNALRGLVNAEAMQNPQAAAALMDRYGSDVNNRVVEQFVWHSFGKDPQLAVQNIGRLTNVEQRDQMYTRTIEHWLGEDKNAAIAWMGSNALPQNVADRLNRSIEKMNAPKKQ